MENVYIPYEHSTLNKYNFVLMNLKLNRFELGDKIHKTVFDVRLNRMGYPFNLILVFRLDYNRSYTMSSNYREHKPQVLLCRA